jgi:hypothetical protein
MPGWPGPLSSYLYFLPSRDDRHEPPYPAFYWLILGLENCQGWPETMILPISTSQIASVTSMKTSKMSKEKNT